MNKDKLQAAVTTIGLYLSANHGCIAIDDGTEESRQIEWRVVTPPLACQPLAGVLGHVVFLCNFRGLNV